MQAWRAGFKYAMFDDNYSVPPADNLSLVLSCSLKMGRLLRTNVKFTDNFGRLSRQLTNEDMLLIDVMFDQVIDVYYEFPFLYKDKGFRGEVLFPDDTYTDIKARFSLSDRGDIYATAAKSYRNVCFVALRQFLAPL